ncbi:MAG: hypothetical protein ACD_28C00310G0004 [uncultured bacterium]|nr:MAG: hypothetical protein ACD_28C00310G0004 [uncultured bacterium]KKT77168.1 MAG: hypothetical protein UW70_C0002G0007 [Candidatus Peregrinibacteria bacterium GW2011_GWA2_44_7]
MELKQTPDYSVMAEDWSPSLEAQLKSEGYVIDDTVEFRMGEELKKIWMLIYGVCLRFKKVFPIGWFEKGL